MVEADFSGLGSGSLGADISKYTGLCVLKSVHFSAYDLHHQLKRDSWRAGGRLRGQRCEDLIQSPESTDKLDKVVAMYNHGDGEAETGGSQRLAGHSGWLKSWALGSQRDPVSKNKVSA